MCFILVLQSHTCCLFYFSGKPWLSGIWVQRVVLGKHTLKNEFLSWFWCFWNCFFLSKYKDTDHFISSSNSTNSTWCDVAIEKRKITLLDIHIQILIRCKVLCDHIYDTFENHSQTSKYYAITWFFLYQCTKWRKERVLSRILIPSWNSV